MRNSLLASLVAVCVCALPAQAALRPEFRGLRVAALSLLFLHHPLDARTAELDRTEAAPRADAVDASDYADAERLTPHTYKLEAVARESREDTAIRALELLLRFEDRTWPEKMGATYTYVDPRSYLAETVRHRSNSMHDEATERENRLALLAGLNAFYPVFERFFESFENEPALAAFPEASVVLRDLRDLAAQWRTLNEREPLSTDLEPDELQRRIFARQQINALITDRLRREIPRLQQWKTDRQAREAELIKRASDRARAQVASEQAARAAEQADRPPPPQRDARARPRGTFKDDDGVWKYFDGTPVPR